MSITQGAGVSMSYPSQHIGGLYRSFAVSIITQTIPCRRGQSGQEVLLWIMKLILNAYVEGIFHLGRP